jgi:2-dehydro-3-deoxyphosphooctonate aldolase (KDO 8-P synthase)
VINIKKGQFLAPWDVKNIVKKAEDSGNCRICVTERGTSFGYNTLVTDMRGLSQMAKDCGYPVIFDATHSVQQPGGLGGTTGGQREFAQVLARAAVAVGVAAVFIETHENPDKALSDGPNSIALKDMERVLSELKAFDQVNKTLISEY